MSDTNFEKLIFMKENGHHVETIYMGAWRSRRISYNGLVMLIE